MDDEYLNLYLNDLIMKISFNNDEQNQYFLKYFIANLRYLKVKVKKNIHYYKKIKSLDLEEQYNYNFALKKNSQAFYEKFEKIYSKFTIFNKIIANNTANKHF